jgi:hypothetical protein
VSPVRYELGFDMPEDGIHHSHRRKTPKSSIMFYVVRVEAYDVWRSSCNEI